MDGEHAGVHELESIRPDRRVSPGEEELCIIGFFQDPLSLSLFLSFLYLWSLDGETLQMQIALAFRCQRQRAIVPSTNIRTYIHIYIDFQSICKYRRDTAPN